MEGKLGISQIAPIASSTTVGVTRRVIRIMMAHFCWIMMERKVAAARGMRKAERDIVDTEPHHWESAFIRFREENTSALWLGHFNEKTSRCRNTDIQHRM